MPCLSCQVTGKRKVVRSKGMLSLNTLLVSYFYHFPGDCTFKLSLAHERCESEPPVKIINSSEMLKRF